MSIQTMKKLRMIVLNETGQMSVFVALIFQVLFVFFAMVINIGLLIHDKINLQNAVDLGAYYAAQRQAEILNEIAHINYQIRQDYKLLAWRYRVLGTLGRIGYGGGSPNTYPPARRVLSMPLNENPWVNPSYGQEPPSVCVSNEMWSDVLVTSTELENSCFGGYGTTIPKIPSVIMIFPNPIVAAAAAATAYAQQQQTASCSAAGPLNWAFTMQIIYAYKHAIGVRKRMIQELRRRLVASDFRGQDNQPVRLGVEKTIKKNLTQSNLDGWDDSGFEFINGLNQSDPKCSEPDFLLPEIKTSMLLLYTFMNSSCYREMRAHTEFQDLPPVELDKWDPDQLMRSLASGEPLNDEVDPTHSSLGFEKNPWCMAYIGVKARTKPRKPFAPFGSPVTLTARAFAQPFGGRVGPWHKVGWSRGSPISDAGNALDVLTTPRVTPGQPASIADYWQWLPNYSRFPGDTMGLFSEAALGAQRHIFLQIGNPSQPKNDRLKLAYYAFFDAIAAYGDPLAWNPFAPPTSAPNPTLQLLRNAEVAAVAPDLFDATYYSVDPNYPSTYGQLNLNGARFTLPPLFGRQVRPPTDLGGRNDHPQLNLFNVSNQIEIATRTGNSGGSEDGFLGNPGTSFYLIRQWEHLLTGWAPYDLQNFTFPEDRFGKCAEVASSKLGYAIPGRCRTGGRVGYSVRLISRDYLLSSSLGIGGTAGNGPILNPPPTDW